MTRKKRGWDPVRRKIARYWPDADPEEIMGILNEYGTESFERGQQRVHLAILKLSNGDIDELPKLVKMAKRDYRDVLAYAEYPEQMRLGFVGAKKLSADEREAMKQRDKKQYRKWLTR